MCGIVGIITRKQTAIQGDQVSLAATMLHRRGPDDSGLWTENNVGLAHQRLSVLDLSPAGHQPMLSPDGRFVIVYNGEIYNFRELRRNFEGDNGLWRSNSDTEVILATYAKWGVDCLKRFHGMFSFAIWDRKERVLFAARDRMGVKPFYYHHSSNCFAFASRPRVLFSLVPTLSKEIDEQALRFYLETGYVPAPYSIYKNIRKLPPAHYILFSDKGLHVGRYWDFRQIQTESSWVQRSEEDLLDELDEIVTRSVNSRLVSDVPLGAFLSGGIDSSLIVAVMAKHLPRPVKTFSIGFAEKAYDESLHAQTVAKYLGAEHHCEYLQVNDLIALMPIFQQEYDEPFFDSSAFPVMAVSRFARKHVTVSLSGDGGDELFGGYHYYQIAHKLNHFFCLPSQVRLGIASLVRVLPQHKFKLLSGVLRQPDRTSAFAFSRSIIKDFNGVLNLDLIQRTKGMYELFLTAAGAFPKGLHPSEHGMRLDFFYTLPDDYLQKVDVSSMAFSLESRDPLLDQDLVEWAMKLPITWKLRKGVNKYLLRKLAYRYIPERMLNRPKQGFSVPIDSWLRGPLKEWAESLIFDKSLVASLPLSSRAVEDLWYLHQSGRRNIHPFLWAIIVFMDFMKRQGCQEL